MQHIAMECRVLLGVCIFSLMCLQMGETQTIAKRVRELCTALQRPNAKPNGADPDYDEDYPNGGPGGAGPRKSPNGGAPDYYDDDYPNAPGGASPKKSPNGAEPDYYEDYPNVGPTRGTGPRGKPGAGPKPDEPDYYGDYPAAGSPKKKTPTAPGAEPNDYYDYPNDNAPTRGSPNRKKPLTDAYDDPLYDEDALGQPEYPDSPRTRGGRPKSPLPKKDDLPQISLTVVCGGQETTKRRIL